MVEPCANHGGDFLPPVGIPLDQCCQRNCLCGFVTVRRKRLRWPRFRFSGLYGSFAEAWTLAGGSLVGATSDAVEERGLVLGEDVSIIGSVKTPALEEILATDPDFVMLSADIEAQTELHDALTEAGYRARNALLSSKPSTKKLAPL